MTWWSHQAFTACYASNNWPKKTIGHFGCKNWQEKWSILDIL